jgi:transposase-like protein
LLQNATLGEVNPDDQHRHFDREIIVLGVRWYLRFKLSLRDLVEMMAERGIDLAHTTIMRWIAP